MNDMLPTLIPLLGGQVVVLAVMIVVIKKMLVGQTMSAVERIKLVETEVRKKEEGIRHDIEKHEREFAAKKVEAEETLEQRRAEADKEVEQVKERTLAEATAAGERIIEQAQKNEEKLRQKIAQDMEEKSVSYAGQMFELVFSEKMNDVLNRQFIGELLDALDEVESGSMTVDASDASFTSSHAIDAEQKARLEALLEDKFSAKVEVKEEINEELIAGMIFKIGSLEIDGSLLNRFKEAAAEVKKTARA